MVDVPTPVHQPSKGLNATATVVATQPSSGKVDKRQFEFILRNSFPLNNSMVTTCYMPMLMASVTQ